MPAISQTDMARLDPDVAALAAVLRTAEVRGDVHPDLIHLADAHGALPLLAWRCRAANGLPEDLRRDLTAIAARAIAWDMWRAAELATLLEAWRAAGVEALVIKGAALARQVYPEPWLRPHGDVDLLVEHASLPRLTQALLALGYAQDTTIDGTCVMYQTHFSRTDGQAVRHALDVHWRIANPQVFAHALGFDELRADAVRIPGLGDALAPCAQHALLLALVHRAAHHYDTHRLIWLFDIHLLAERLDAQDWARLVTLAVERKVARVAWRGLELADEAFGVSWPTDVRRQLAESPDEDGSAAFLDGIRRQVDVLRSDLGALPHLRARARLVREHLFPSRAYMSARYRTASAWMLPWLYARRILSGAPRWLRPFVTDDSTS